MFSKSCWISLGTLFPHFFPLFPQDGSTNEDSCQIVFFIPYPIRFCIKVLFTSSKKSSYIFEWADSPRDKTKNFLWRFFRTYLENSNFILLSPTSFFLEIYKFIFLLLCKSLTAPFHLYPATASSHYVFIYRFFICCAKLSCTGADQNATRRKKRREHNEQRWKIVETFEIVWEWKAEKLKSLFHILELLLLNKELSFYDCETSWWRNIFAFSALDWFRANKQTNGSIFGMIPFILRSRKRVEQSQCNKKKKISGASSV